MNQQQLDFYAENDAALEDIKRCAELEPPL
jgi:hypothetical protein